MTDERYKELYEEILWTAPHRRDLDDTLLELLKMSTRWHTDFEGNRSIVGSAFAKELVSFIAEKWDLNDY